MKFCNLVKLMDQYCGKNFQAYRGFQYEVTEESKCTELFHVKGSLAVHAPPIESNLAGAPPCPQILFLNFIKKKSAYPFQLQTSLDNA